MPLRRGNAKAHVTWISLHFTCAISCLHFPNDFRLSFRDPEVDGPGELRTNAGTVHPTVSSQYLFSCQSRSTPSSATAHRPRKLTNIRAIKRNSCPSEDSPKVFLQARYLGFRFRSLCVRSLMMNVCSSRSLVIVIAGLAILCTPVAAADWPMWRHDAGRTATSIEEIPATENITRIWSRELPAPAPAYRDPRLQFDAGYEPIVLGKRLFLGSNRDDNVTAFDTDSGAELWKFYTNGPVRFAPVGGDGRVIFGSDDGCVYCLNVSDGSLVWKHRAVPSGRLVFGNGRLVSVWPIRGGPVLYEGHVFFAAGVWPLEGTFVFCLNAATGEVIWRNDRASYLYGVHPHNAQAYGGLAPQGYLLIDGEDLVVPSSQAYPARFDLSSGKLKAFELPKPGRLPGGWFASTPAEKEALKLKRRGLLFDNKVNSKRHEDKLRNEGLPEIRSTIRIADREVRFADRLPGVDGEVQSIVAADGKLFVTTKEGTLTALGKPADTVVKRPDRPQSSPQNQGSLNGASTLDLPGVQSLPANGHAILLGVPDARRIERLLSRTRLTVVGIDHRRDRIESLRRMNWQGHPVSFLEADPTTVELPPYCASLIVADESLRITAGEIRLHFESLRPFGGKLIGRSQNLAVVAKAANLPGVRIKTEETGWTTLTREGPLDGATNYIGDWTENSDQRVRAPLGLLWFGDSITHFKRSPQPKFIDGIMVSNPKNWSDRSTREMKVDYRLLGTVFSDVYTGRILAADEAPHLREFYSGTDRITVQPSQYRPVTQKDDWKPDQPRVGERINPLTGEKEPRTFPKSYGCDGGVDYGLMYSMRSGTPAFYDKRIESGTVNVSGPRSGCTNSIIPANGVLNIPYYYEGCTCSYPLPVALALVSKPQSFEQWASWGTMETEKLQGKIQRLGINFGAPGDRVTEDGTLWLDAPNIGGPSPQIHLTTEPPLDTLETVYQHSLFLEQGVGWPWVAGSGMLGLHSVTINGMKPGVYRVRLTTTKGGGRHRFETRNLASASVGDDHRLLVPIPHEDPAQLVCGIEILRTGLPSTPPIRFSRQSNHLSDGAE